MLLPRLLLTPLLTILFLLLARARARAPVRASASACACDSAPASTSNPSLISAPTLASAPTPAFTTASATVSFSRTKLTMSRIGPQASNLLEESIVLPGGVREYAPALTLFDNAVIARREQPQAISRAQYNKSKALVTALNQLLPCPADLEIILEAGKDWWQIWRKMFPEITDHRCQNLKESVSHSLRSESPAEVAKIMLCIANSVYQMPAGFDWHQLQLKESPEELMERYINTVDRLVIADDEIAATVDGIECIVLEAKYHINMGRPRRAWLLMHRAIAFAQLLGLHRLSSRKPEKPDGEYARQVSLWCHLFAGDKFLSLLLGLPYSVQEQYCRPYIPGPNSDGFPGTTEGEVYLAKMIPIITKVVDRNQSPTPMPYSATLRIDQDIEELYNAQDHRYGTSHFQICSRMHFSKSNVLGRASYVFEAASMALSSCHLHLTSDFPGGYISQS